MDLLRALPEAAPILLRHLAAYAELLSEDLARAQRELAARIMASVMIGVSLAFALAMACLAILARTWDTPYRVASIAWMGAAFLFVAIVCGLIRSRVVRAQATFLGSIKDEWRQDRIALERILSVNSD
jgi:uncharacterized membrane protein YqjE